MNTYERFWSKVDRRGEDECWPWKASRKADGYGQAWVDGRPIPAHRAAYMDSKGDIPEGKIIRHTCDNSPCCNPKHLILGTHRDNARDREERGRATRDYMTGDRNWATKLTGRRREALKSRLVSLTDADVAGRTLEEVFASLAAEFGVARTTMHRVMRTIAPDEWSFDRECHYRETLSAALTGRPRPAAHGEANARTTVTDAMLGQIKAELPQYEELPRNQRGAAWREMARRYGVHYDTIYRIARGHFRAPISQGPLHHPRPQPSGA